MSENNFDVIIVGIRRITLDAHILDRAKEHGVAVQEKTVITDLVGTGTEKAFYLDKISSIPPLGY